MEKEFKKMLKSKLIEGDRYGTFSDNLQKFLDKNPDVKIIQKIVHKPFIVTLIYEVSVEVK